MEKYKTFTKDDLTLKIYYDESAESPRDWDNLGTMIYKNSRYTLGDEQSDFNGSFEEFRDYLIKERKAVIIMPIFLYDHSGITISTTQTYPYNCRWDSSPVGYIFATKEDIRENFGVKKVTKKLLETTKRILQGEIDTFDLYIRGEVFGFQLMKIKKCKECDTETEEILDSCWGFFGDNLKENGIIDNADIKDFDKWVEK